VPSAAAFDGSPVWSNIHACAGSPAPSSSSHGNFGRGAAAGRVAAGGAGSPRHAHSPVLSQMGVGSSNTANNCSADSMKSLQNGHAMIPVGMSTMQQAHPGNLSLQACGSPNLYQQQQPQPAHVPQQPLTSSTKTAAEASITAVGAAAAALLQQQLLLLLPVTGSRCSGLYRGVSYDKKKRKWRVQIKVAALGKSGVSSSSDCSRAFLLSLQQLHLACNAWRSNHAANRRPEGHM